MQIILSKLLMLFVRFLLSLRYKIIVKGDESISLADKKHGTLFLPNHPAMVDPVIVTATLYRYHPVYPLAKSNEIDYPLIRSLCRLLGVITMSDLTSLGRNVKSTVDATIDEIVKTLESGKSVVLYPAGRIYRTKSEYVGANSAVEQILKRLPDTDVVAMRSTGLWGSMFSFAWRDRPDVMHLLFRSIKMLAKSLLFFMPRRKVEIEMSLIKDMPRTDRKVINSYLEKFYNLQTPTAEYVPYHRFEKSFDSSELFVDESEVQEAEGDFPADVVSKVNAWFYEQGATGEIASTDDLGSDLGLDSIIRADLILWLGSEFGALNLELDSLSTVADTYNAASGHLITRGGGGLKPVHESWFVDIPEDDIVICGKQTNIVSAFLHQLKKSPKRALLADQMVGVKNFKEIALAVELLAPIFAKSKSKYVGIMMPATATSVIAFLSVVAAGKIPVMLNWTVGSSALAHAVKSAELDTIITAKKVADKLRGQGIDLAPVEKQFVYIEQVAKELTLTKKLMAVVKLALGVGALHRTAKSIDPDSPVVVLFTSGSENLPKAVPITHRNLEENILGAVELAHLKASDCLLGILPPFHSFGMLVNIYASLAGGLRVVFHPNPTDAYAIAAIAERYQGTMLIGTPTFVNGILTVSQKEQLETLRLIVVGAEACPDALFDLAAEKCPKAAVIEGYGITECSPVVSVTPTDALTRGTIGKVISVLDWILIDPESGEMLEDAGKPVGKTGMLLVSGPSVFGGYLFYSGESPFIEINGKSWYKTGDLVEQHADGLLYFKGRLKRFVKIGGEMISLPAIESAVSSIYPADEDGPKVAIVANEDDRPKLILCSSVKNVDIAEVNATISKAGLSPLHNVKAIIDVDAIPQLGTGKINYRELQKLV